MAVKADKLQSVLFFVVVAVGLSLCAIWLLSHNYVNEFAISRWSKVLTVLDSPEIRLEHLGLIYPHFPVYILIPFYYLPGMDSGAASYFASVLVGAALIGIWNYHLTKKQYSFKMRIMLVLLVCSHPYFLWGVTTGAQHALSLLMFYWLYISLVRLVNMQDVRAFIMIGLVMAVYFFIDERTLYMFLALLPLLSIVAPQRMLKESTSSVYLIIAAPLGIAVASWAYLNWIFHDDAGLFIRSASSSFRGAWQDVAHVDWLRNYGGQYIVPTLLTALLSFLVYPVLFWLLYHAKRHRILMGSTLVLLVHLIVATGLATGNNFLAHPMNMVFLFSAGIMAGIVLIPRETKSARIKLLGLLALSCISGWMVFSWSATVDMQHWKTAMLGTKIQETNPGDIALGQWLKVNRQPTMLDDEAAYRVIVSRGDAKNLVLPSSSEFKISLKYKWPNVEQLAVPDPSHVYKGKDALNLQFPNIYANGLPGYQLVYDHLHWRVYRRYMKVSEK